MAEITCPKCHTTFNISEEEYKSIRAQLRDQEFTAALHEREQAFEQRKQDAVELAEAAVKENMQRELAGREQQIAVLRAKVEAAAKAQLSAVNEIAAQKDAEISKLLGQINNQESAYKLKLQEEVAKKDADISQLQGQISDKENEYKLKLQEEIAKKNAENISLQEQIRKKETEQELAVTNAVREKETEIERLNAQINAKKTEQNLAVQNAVSEKEKELSRIKVEVEQLKGQLDTQKTAAELEQNNIKARFEQELKFKDEEIERIKDFKAKQSTKMIGESLEVFCQNEFNKIRAIGFQNATFGKDNELSETNSKGDFIFREAADGVEFISIMFEMKNEMDTTQTKHKNEHFFKELDKDRREKNCEYAVLVSLLEPDNDYYNNGIVDVSHEYEKMYVVRPQFFIPIITLLRNAAKNSLSYKKELMEVRNQNVDITNFETQLNDYKDKFMKDCSLAGKNFNTAIDEIDKTIKKLEKIKSELQKTITHLSQGNNKLQDITVKRLVRGNPTMKAKFDELKANQADESDSGEE